VRDSGRDPKEDSVDQDDEQERAREPIAGDARPGSTTSPTHRAIAHHSSPTHERSTDEAADQRMRGAEGRPKYQVTRFQAIAADSAASTVFSGARPVEMSPSRPSSQRRCHEGACKFARRPRRALPWRDSARLPDPRRRRSSRVVKPFVKSKLSATADDNVRAEMCTTFLTRSLRGRRPAVFARVDCFLELSWMSFQRMRVIASAPR